MAVERQLGDVVFYDERGLSSHIDFLIWKALTRSDIAWLSAADGLAVTRLRDGLATEASRPALLWMLVDCLLLEIIRHPDRGAELVTTLADSGLQHAQM